MGKFILGLVADISAGKDTAARYLAEKHGFERHTLSDILRAEARVRKLTPTRENLVKIVKELRKKEGIHALIRRAIKKSKKDKIVIVGIREKEEIDYLKEKFPGKVKILRLTADPKIRFERIKTRGRTGDPKTFKEFLAQEKREWEEFDFKTLFKMADYKIVNDGTVEELYRELDKALKKLGP